MNDNIPPIAFILKYLEVPDDLEPFSLKILSPILGTTLYREFEFFKPDVEAIKTLYWVIRRLPSQVNKYMEKRISPDFCKGSDEHKEIRKPLENLIDRLNQIAVTEAAPFSGRFIETSFYLGTLIETPEGVPSTINSLVTLIRGRLNDFLNFRPSWYCIEDLRRLFTELVSYWESLAWPLFIFIHFFIELDSYSKVRYYSSFSDLEHEQFEYIKARFCNEFRIFNYACTF